VDSEDDLGRCPAQQANGATCLRLPWNSSPSVVVVVVVVVVDDETREPRWVRLGRGGAFFFPLLVFLPFVTGLP
jgi:hypothetical protein